MMWRLISVCSLVATLIAPSVASAAFGFGDIVFDPSNYAENFATALSTAATLTEAIQITRNTMLNIVSLEEVIMAESEYMSELEQLWTEGVAIARAIQDVSSQVSRLFGTDTLPVTAYAYQLRRSEIYQLKNTAACNAWRVQRLITSSANLIRRIARYLQSIGVIVGVKQSTLTQLQVQMETVKEQKEASIRQTAMHHVELLDRMDDASAVESLKLITDDAFKNW